MFYVGPCITRPIFIKVKGQGQKCENSKVVFLAVTSLEVGLFASSKDQNIR